MPPQDAPVSRPSLLPRLLPPPTHCKRCGAPTPDDWARMRHDELHADRYEHEDM